jgi:hypothetical protein
MRQTAPPSGDKIDSSLPESITIYILHVQNIHKTRNSLFSMLVPGFPVQCFSTANSGLNGLELFRELQRQSKTVTLWQV